MNEQHRHGEYQPGLGFYDSSLRGWIKDAAKLTQVIDAKPVTQGQRDEVARWGKARGFTPVPELESLMRLRDSGRQEERETFHKLAAGGKRMTLADYETKRAEAIRSGQWRPGSVA